MDNENNNKIPSVSLADLLAQEAEKAKQEALKKQEEAFSSPSNYEYSAPTYEVTEADRQFVYGNQPRVKMKSNKGKIITLSIIAVIILGLIGSYLFVPFIKASVNNTFLDGKGYYKWAMRNTLNTALYSKDYQTKKLDGATYTFSMGDTESSIYYSKDAAYIKSISNNGETIFEVYSDSNNQKTFAYMPSKADSWVLLDKENYDGEFASFLSLDLNSYFRDSDFNSASEKYLDIFLDNVSNIKREKDVGQYINGNVYKATKITFSMDGNQFLKCLSDIFFEIAEDEDALGYLYDSKGITKEQVLEIANDANMIRQGMSGTFEANFDFTWYINNLGIITGLELNMSVPQSNGTTANSLVVINFGADKSGFDLEAYTETNKVRAVNIKISATNDKNKYSGSGSVNLGELSLPVNFENIEIKKGDIISGVKGNFTVTDKMSLAFDYDNNKQFITVNGETPTEIILSAEKTNSFTAPDVSNAPIIYNDDNWISLGQ